MKISNYPCIFRDSLVLCDEIIRNTDILEYCDYFDSSNESKKINDLVIIIPLILVILTLFKF